MARPTIVNLTDDERGMLELWARDQDMRQRRAWHARLILMWAEGRSRREIATKLGVTVTTVGVFERRFCSERLACIEDENRRGRPPKESQHWERKIVEATMQTKPKGAAQWTGRTLSEHLGISQGLVYRVWEKYGLTPQRRRK